MKPIAIMIHVDDVIAAVDWYAKAFPSSTVLSENNDCLAILDMNGFALEIVRADEKVCSGKMGSVLYWLVSDLTAALSRFETIGAVLYRGPLLIDDGLAMCQIEDPFGNLIGLKGQLNLNCA